MKVGSLWPLNKDRLHSAAYKYIRLKGKVDMDDALARQSINFSVFSGQRVMSIPER